MLRTQFDAVRYEIFSNSINTIYDTESIMLRLKLRLFGKRGRFSYYSLIMQWQSISYITDRQLVHFTHVLTT